MENKKYQNDFQKIKQCNPCLKSNPATHHPLTIPHEPQTSTHTTPTHPQPTQPQPQPHPQTNPNPDHLHEFMMRGVVRV